MSRRPRIQWLPPLPRGWKFSTLLGGVAGWGLVVALVWAPWAYGTTTLESGRILEWMLAAVLLLWVGAAAGQPPVIGYWLMVIGKKAAKRPVIGGRRSEVGEEEGGGRQKEKGKRKKGNGAVGPLGDRGGFAAPRMGDGLEWEGDL